MAKHQQAIDSDSILRKIIQKVETHYADKFTYAVPNWAMISALPEIFAILTVYGKDGIAIMKEKVTFDVDFNRKNSLEYYVDFLQKKMNIREEVAGYVFFYTENIMLVKDIKHTSKLTDDQVEALHEFNQNQVENYSLLITDKDLNVVDSTDALLACFNE